MKFIRIIVPLTLMAVAAFAQQVQYGYDHKVDFGKYKTYKWVEVKGADHLDQLTDKQLKDAIDLQLSKKGLVKTTDNADLAITYQAAITQQVQFTAYTELPGPGWGYGQGWVRGWGYDDGRPIGTTTTQSTPIYVGSVGFDMYDATQQKLVWRGEVAKTIDTKAKPGKRQKNIEKSIAKLLKNYPPPTK